MTSGNYDWFDVVYRISGEYLCKATILLWLGSCLSGLCCHGAPVRYGHSGSPDWKIIETEYSTADVVIAGYKVTDFGAVGDGVKDCSRAFQQALHAMSRAGGGTVFVPAGKYAIRSTLKIPASVTLRGEWQSPLENKPLEGTILMVYAGRGSEKGTPFISVDECAGIKDLSIWYPEQNPDKIVPYPYCLIQAGGDNATFENLTLVNPYLGIRIGPGGNELHYVHNVYGTPLKKGIEYDTTTDIGRLENINFAPHFWEESGLPRAPLKDGAMGKWLLKNGTGLHMKRSDWEYASYITVEGYNRGYYISKGKHGAANAQFYYLNIKNCQTAIEIEETNAYGMVFTKCLFYGNECGIRIGREFTSAILFSHCVIGGGSDALHSYGRGSIIILQSEVSRGDIMINGGAVAVTSCIIKEQNTVITLGESIKGASIAGTDFKGGSAKIVNRGPKSALKFSSEPVKLYKFPEYNGNKQRVGKPAKEELYVVTESRWGASSGDIQDDTRAIQKALDYAGKTGGGVVFVPAGDYVIKGILQIPSGVELRGVHDVPHHTKVNGSILHIYPPVGCSIPTISMQAASGMRGMSFNYPEQDIYAVKEYPFLLQGQGRDIYIVNVNCANAYRYLDLSSFQCDNHYVDYLSGAPLSVGVTVGGGSVNGEIRNMQFNPHYWTRSDKSNRFFKNSPSGSINSSRGGGKALWTYQKAHLDAMVVGSCRNQFLFQNFVFGSLYGIHFLEQNGGSPLDCVSHGHGTDGSKVGVYFEKGSHPVYMINNQLVSMSSENKTAIKLGPNFRSSAALFNTLVWGSPDLLADVENGKLLLEGAHCTRHGDGIKLKKGFVRAVNIDFANSNNHVLISGDNSKMDIIGCITPKTLLVNQRPCIESNPDLKINALLNIQRGR